MPNTPRSEPLPETFTGDTLEEAMATAVATLGPGLTVLSAHKVRAGVRGLVGRPRYEVAARGPAQVARVPAPPAAPPGDGEDAVDRALASLLAQADETDEVNAGRRGRRVRTRAEQLAPPSPTTGFVPGFRPAQDLDDDVVDIVVVPAARSAGRHAQQPRAAGPTQPGDDPADPVDGSAGPDDRLAGPVDGSAGSRVPPTPAAGPAPESPGPVRWATARTPAAAASCWSRATLARLGLPAALLDELPAEPPADDLGWLVWLTHTLERHLPAPVAPGADCPVVLSGYGLPGALALLDAALHGGTIGTIDHGAGPVPATAVELALELRNSLGSIR